MPIKQGLVHTQIVDLATCLFNPLRDIQGLRWCSITLYPQPAAGRYRVLEINIDHSYLQRYRNIPSFQVSNDSIDLALRGPVNEAPIELEDSCMRCRPLPGCIWSEHLHEVNSPVQR